MTVQRGLTIATFITRNPKPFEHARIQISLYKHCPIVLTNLMSEVP